MFWSNTVAQNGPFLRCKPHSPEILQLLLCLLPVGQDQADETPAGGVLPAGADPGGG